MKTCLIQLCHKLVYSGHVDQPATSLSIKLSPIVHVTVETIFMQCDQATALAVNPKGDHYPQVPLCKLGGSDYSTNLPLITYQQDGCEVGWQLL